LRYCQNPHRPRTSKASKINVYFIKKSLDAAHELPGAKGFQTAWRGTRAIRHQAPLMLLFPQVSPSGITLIAKRNTLQFSTGFVAIAWRSNTSAKRYTSTCTVLVFQHPEQVKTKHSHF